MKYKLKTPLKVHSFKTGTLIDCNTIEIEFTGRDGISAIDSLQDIVLKEFMLIQSQSSLASEKEAYKASYEKDNQLIQQVQSSKEEGLKFLHFIKFFGIYEKLGQKIFRLLETYATVNNEKLDKDKQDAMDIKDLINLREVVITNFLLQRLSSAFQNMTKSVVK